MFHSLHARLWLSYAVLIITALTVVGTVLVLFLVRNPVLYRNTFVRLTAAEAVLSLQATPADQLEEVSRAFGVRALLFASNGRLISDSGGNQPAIGLPSNPLKLSSTGGERDFSGNVWFYSVKRLSDGDWLLVVSPRPKVVPFLALVKDELSAPFMEGGVIALLLSLLLAFVIARWVADPLEQIVAAARTMPSESIRPVAEQGPREVQELARAFNAMVARVQASRAVERDFVANVSHELKTPLTSIQGFAQALMDGTADKPEERHQAAKVIYNEAGRMHRMALDLLDLARLDTGTAEFKQVPVDMRALLGSNLRQVPADGVQHGRRAISVATRELAVIFRGR